jgi:predicted MFS family arabinose efflux permease
MGDLRSVVTRRLFGTLCGLVFLVNLGRVVFAPLVEPLMSAFAVEEATLGAVITLVWLATASARIPTGYLLTRVSRRRVVLAAGGLLAVGAVVAASASSIPVLAAGAALLGLATGVYFVAAVPLIGRLYPDRVGRAVGIHGTATQLAAVAAPTLAVAVLAVGSWRGVFWALAVGTLCTTLVLRYTIDEAPASSARTPDRAFSDAVRGYWPLLATAIVFVAATGFVWQGVFNFYPTYLIRAKGLSPGLANALLTVAFAAGVPGFWFGGRLADSLPQVPYVLSIIAGFAGSLFVLTYTSSVLGLVVVTVCMGYAIHSLFPALDAFLLGALPTDADASGYAVYSGGALFIEATGSAVTGALVGAGVGFETVFRAGALGLGVVLVGLCALYRLDRLPGARPTPDPDPSPAPGRP